MTILAPASTIKAARTVSPSVSVPENVDHLPWLDGSPLVTAAFVEKEKHVSFEQLSWTTGGVRNRERPVSGLNQQGPEKGIASSLSNGGRGSTRASQQGRAGGISGCDSFPGVSALLSTKIASEAIPIVRLETPAGLEAYWTVQQPPYQG